MYKRLIDRLGNENDLTADEYLRLIEHREEIREYAAERAVAVRQKYYGKKVFIRALIEFTNYCKNNCFYCGIRAGNGKAERYRLTAEEILACAAEGYKLGFSVADPKALMPGDFIYSIEDFKHFFENVLLDNDHYVVERNAVNKLLHKYPDGNNCERLSKMIGIC